MSTRYYPGEVEVWKDVPGYIGLYQASTFGRVKSLKRKVPHSRSRAITCFERILSQHTTSRWGHLNVDLCFNGKRCHFKSHRVILETFVGPCPPGFEGCHEDGVPWHNHISNLRWDTHKNNEKDKVRHGKTTRGEKSVNSKLTEKDIPKIRKLVLAGLHSYQQIGDLFFVSLSTVYDIASRRTWGWLK